MLPLLLLIGTGLWGLDFGLHWDEGPWQIGPTKHMVETRTLLPGYYDYPSFDYWLNLAVLSPHVLTARRTGETTGAHLVRVLDSPEYLLSLRAVYLVIASLTLVWVYLLVLRLRGSPLEAFLAASLLGSSWEVAYHLRWVASDGMLMQFAPLTVLLAIHAVDSRREIWLVAAAIAAGFGLGTKYPGGLLILPVMFAAVLRSAGESPATTLLRLARVVCVAGLVFLVITPAVVLQPREVLNAVLYEIKHYATGHGGHTVGRGLEHARRMLTYFSMALFSTRRVIALTLFGLAGVGCVSAITRNRRVGAVLFVFPFAYLFYFSSQGTMVARNLLAVAPFFAIAAARGAVSIGTWLARKDAAPLTGWRSASPAQVIWAALLAAALGVNAAWLIASARSIVDRHSDRFAREAAAYIAAHRETTFLLSPRAKRDLRLVGAAPTNIAASVADADAFVLYAREGMRRWHDWPANRPQLTRASFGPREVNVNIYPNWWGDDRIIVIDRPRATEMGLLIAGISDDASAPIDRAPQSGSPEAPPEDPGFAGPLATSWTLPPDDPRVLVTATEAQSIIGALLRGPVLGSWELDGRGCTFVGADGTVVSVVIISTSAFDLERHARDSVAIVNVGASAYTERAGPFGDVRLFARTKASAVVVHVADGSGSGRASIAVANRFARIALTRQDRLRRFGD